MNNIFNSLTLGVFKNNNNKAKEEEIDGSTLVEAKQHYKNREYYSAGNKYKNISESLKKKSEELKDTSSHPDIANYFKYAANSYYHFGLYKDAKQCIEQSLKFTSLEGENEVEHYKIMIIKILILIKQEYYQEALTPLKDVLKFFEKQPQNDETIKVLLKLNKMICECYSHLNFFEDAFIEIKKIHRYLRAMGSFSNKWNLEPMLKARVFFQMGQLDKASKFLDKIQKSESLNEEDDFEVLGDYYKMMAFCRMERSEESAQKYQELLMIKYKNTQEEVRKSVKLPKNFEFAKAELLYVPSLLNQKNLNEAFERCEKALTIGTRTFGDYHQQNVKTLRVIANICLNDNRPDEALTIVNKIMDITKTIHGGSHYQMAQWQALRATVYQKLNKSKYAYQDYQKCIQISSAWLGESKPEIAKYLILGALNQDLLNPFPIQKVFPAIRIHLIECFKKSTYDMINLYPFDILEESIYRETNKKFDRKREYLVQFVEILDDLDKITTQYKKDQSEAGYIFSLILAIMKRIDKQQARTLLEEKANLELKQQKQQQEGNQSHNNSQS